VDFQGVVMGEAKLSKTDMPHHLLHLLASY
jgi:hypothetical protein